VLHGGIQGGGVKKKKRTSPILAVVKWRTSQRRPRGVGFPWEMGGGIISLKEGDVAAPPIKKDTGLHRGKEKIGRSPFNLS